MPKETFFNLRDIKRDRVVQAALEEFAKYPYERASLSTIVQNAGIAKGSMYQYFADKQDLYLYIIKRVYDSKRNYLQDVFAKDQDFFATLQRYYQRAYMFAVEYPLYHQIAINFWESKDDKLHQEIIDNKELRASDFTRMLIQAMEDGQVNPNLSKEAAFFVYHSVGKELIENFQGLSAEEAEKHLEFIRDVLDILAYGLGRKGEQSWVKN